MTFVLISSSVRPLRPAQSRVATLLAAYLQEHRPPLQPDRSQMRSWSLVRLFRRRLPNRCRRHGRDGPARACCDHRSSRPLIQYGLIVQPLFGALAGSRAIVSRTETAERDHEEVHPRTGRRRRDGRPCPGRPRQGCNGPLCQAPPSVDGGGLFGRILGRQPMPAFQAAPWYLYWPYNAHFMTPAPLQGAYYAPPTGGGMVNPYFQSSPLHRLAPSPR